MSDFFSSPAIADRAVQAFFEKNKYNTTLSDAGYEDIVDMLLHDDKESLVSFVDACIIRTYVKRYISIYQPLNNMSSRIW